MDSILSIIHSSVTINNILKLVSLVITCSLLHHLLLLKMMLSMQQTFHHLMNQDQEMLISQRKVRLLLNTLNQHQL